MNRVKFIESLRKQGWRVNTGSNILEIWKQTVDGEFSSFKLDLNEKTRKVDYLEVFSDDPAIYTANSATQMLKMLKAIK